MRAVFRHELSSYFTGVTGYVFGAFLLLFTGIYTMVYNLQSASVHFEYVLGSMSFVFLIIVPILTIRVLAEERRQKTDQLLYSLPLTMTQVVLGKFAAMLVVFTAPMAVICLYPVVLSAYGNVYLPAAYGAIVGFFFLGMALLAIGMYISSVTESQAVAAGLCFVVMLVNYFLSDLAGFASSTAYSSLAALALTALIACGIVYLMTKNGFVSLLLAAVLEAGLIGGYLWDSSRFEGLFPQIISQLSLFARFYTIVNGVFDVTATKQAFISEEVVAGLAWNGDAFIAMQENPDLEFIVPEEGMLIWLDNFAIPAGAEHKENAYKFISYLMRPEVAKLCVEEFNYSTPNKAAEKILEPEYAESKVIVLDPEELAKGEVTVNVGKARELYEKYWEQLKAGD